MKLKSIVFISIFLGMCIMIGLFAGISCSKNVESFAVQSYYNWDREPSDEELPLTRSIDRSSNPVSRSIITEGFHQINKNSIGMDMRVINNVSSEEECHKLCDEETSFDCAVYEYHKEYNVCSIGTKSKLDFLIDSTDTGINYTAFNADMEEVSEFKGFHKLPDCTPIRNSGIVKTSADNVMSAKSCSVSCALDSRCVAFSWNRDTQTCTHFPFKVDKSSVNQAFGVDCYVRK